MFAFSLVRRLNTTFFLYLTLLGTLATVQLSAADTTAVNQCGFCYADGAEGERILIALESTEVVLDVKPGLIEAEVIQTFTNHTAAALEATYLYPLPHGATLTDFELRFQDHVMRSSVHEKQTAQVIYDHAKAEGKKTALLVQHDSSLFSTAVANFLPGETVHIVLRFLMPLTLSANAVDIRFPMVTGDRYFPADTIPGSTGNASPNPPRTTGSSLAGKHFYAFDILVAGIPVKSIQSDSHRIKVQQSGEDQERISLEEEITIPDRDFLLRIETNQTQKILPTVVTQRTATGDYGMLTVFPPLNRRSATKSEKPRDVLFLLDHSGSMNGPRIASARLGLQHCLTMLRPADRFRIAIFDDEYAFFRPDWSMVNPSTLADAEKYIQSIQANGGTEVQKVLGPCLDLFENNNREQLVIFLTDGDVGNEASLLNLVESRIRRTRLFAFGIGDAPNAPLITRMAVAGHGQARFIKDDNAVDRELGDMFATLDAPVLSDLQLALLDAQGQPVDATFFPEKIGDVFLGRPLQIVYRTTGQTAAVLKIEGQEDNQAVTMRVPVQSTPLRGDGIEKHFGRMWYDELDREAQRITTNDDKIALRKQMLDTALLFELVTELTSRVAVEQQISRLPNAPLVSQRIGQAQPADQVRADGTIVLSPFVVESEEDTGYTSGGCFAGSRMRTALRDVSADVSIITEQFLDDFGQFKLEDVSPFTVEPVPNPVSSGTNTSLLNGLPIATVIDPVTVSRIESKSSGPAWTTINQRQAGYPGKNRLTARVGDEGVASATLESAFKLGAGAGSPVLSIFSWEKFDHPQWSAWLNAKTDFGDSRLLTTLQARQLDGYGSMRMTHMSLEHKISEGLTLETTVAWHELQRENARQFERNSSTAHYDNLGFLNLDLLTAETSSLKDTLAEVRLDGFTQTETARNSWALQGSWHRAESDWVTTPVAQTRSTAGLNLSWKTRFPTSRLELETDLGLTRHYTPGETDELQSTREAAAGVTWEFADNVNAFVNASREESLPWAPTGFLQIDHGLPQAVSQNIEHRLGGQAGVNMSAWDDRLSFKAVLFHEDITDFAFRDWAWERDHAGAGTVALSGGLLRQPLSYSRWAAWQREGWMGEINFMPVRSVTCRATWYYDWKNNGPYQGGNRQASFVAKYAVLQGFMKGMETGFAVSTRNSMVFNDGYKLPGGTRWDLLFSYRHRLIEGKWFKVQLNLMNLGNAQWQPTRFAKDHGRQILLSVSQEF